MKKILLFFLLLVCTFQSSVFAQSNKTDTIAVEKKKNFNWKGDFRFRTEFDEDIYRQGDKNRTRFRYRLRVGFTKELGKNFKVGTSLRTINQNDYHTPFVTLGGNGKVFGTVQLAFEKLYAEYRYKKFWAWVGKNQYPFWKQNELLWNDNIRPEGAALGLKLNGGKDLKISPALGYFVTQSNNTTLGNDGYLVSAQVDFQWQFNSNQKLIVNFGDLYFKNIPNIPNDEPDFYLDYNIINFSVAYNFQLKNKPISVGFDNFYNTINNSEHNEMMGAFSKEKRGFVGNLKIGELKKKGDFNLHFYYAHIEKYAVVDFLAQNDWARWDYGQYNSRAGRLSGFSGFEIRSCYLITDRIKLIFRYFNIQELIPRGTQKEYGHRVRLDFDVKF